MTGMYLFQVGWAHADMPPGMMLGQDENSWAFDGYNVSSILYLLPLLNSQIYFPYGGRLSSEENRKYGRITNK